MAKVSAKGRLKAPFTEDDLLHTGSVMLNLAISGNPNGGYLKGKYFYFVGDSSSGKSFFTLTALAEATLNPLFDEYRLIYDDVEGGALMDIEKYFGPELANRIEPPRGTRESPLYSAYVEEFYFSLDDAFKKNIPFIYILDSQDALDSLYSDKKFKELKTAVRNPSKDKPKGDYGDGKAKFHSIRLRGVVNKLRESGSILIIVNQTRDVLDSKPFGPKSQASGGRALRFYASVQIWTSVRGKKVKTINKKRRQIGITAQVALKKNRITGKEWTVDVPIYFSHGIDNLGSCVEFLAEEGRWHRAKEGGVITASDFDGIAGNLDKVVRQIEEANLEDEVYEVAQEVYEDLELKSKVERKSRYHKRSEDDEQP